MTYQTMTTDELKAEHRRQVRLTETIPASRTGTWAQYQAAEYAMNAVAAEIAARVRAGREPRA